MIFQFLKSWLKIALYVFIIIIFPKKLYKGKTTWAHGFYCVGVWLPLHNRLPNVLGYNVWYCTGRALDFQTPFSGSIIAFHSAKGFTLNYRAVCFLFCCLARKYTGHLVAIQGKEPVHVNMLFKAFDFPKYRAIDFKQCLL